MRYFLARFTEINGEFEYNDVMPVSVDDEVNLDEYSKELARCQRGSEESDWDEDMEGYWYGGVAVVGVPSLRKITKEQYDTLKAVGV